MFASKRILLIDDTIQQITGLGWVNTYTHGFR